MRGWLAAVFPVAVATATAMSGCSSATRSVPAPVGTIPPAAATPVSAADVHFMSGMIPHHAQAVLIAGWVASHGTREDLVRLAERIIVAQRDEIALMRNWLRDRGQSVPDSNATHLRMKMGGMEHDMLMPGMLGPEELTRLDRARGAEFDRLFLTSMIRHHQGAIAMVDELFGSHGAGQDEVVFRFASDVYADQTTEIERMEQMLAQSPAARVP